MSKSIYFKKIGKYTLSCIERDWHTQEGTFSGIESAIFVQEENEKYKRPVLMVDWNLQEEFEKMKTEADVLNSINDYEN